MPRDRTGEPIEDGPDDDAPHACTGGWIGEDHDGRPVACLVCRPWLRRRKPPTPDEEAAARDATRLTESR